MDDMKTLRPTVFPVVPRLLNRIYDGVLSKVSTSRIKEALFNLVSKDISVILFPKSRTVYWTRVHRLC